MMRDQRRMLVFSFQLILLMLLAFTSVVQAQSVGSTQYVRGTATLRHDDGNISIMSRGSDIQQGDEIYTSGNSFAVLQFDDDTRMTLRPNTTFRIDEYRYKPEAPQQNSGFFSLIRGGFRAVTGLINKHAPQAMRFKTRTATIGIRGTEFDARLCENDCDTEQKPGADNLAKEIPRRAVGRVAFMRGKATAVSGLASTPRQLTTGGPLYENDLVKTAPSSFAVLAFVDQSRVTLRPDSELHIEQFQFEPEKPAENKSIMQMVKGGMRMLTGLIGKLNRPLARVYTRTATIGIRGTGFDLLCQGDCGENDQASLPSSNPPWARLLDRLIKPVQAQAAGNGMFVHVWSGQITMQQQSRTTLLETGWSAFLADRLQQPRLMKVLPLPLQNFGAPRPDKVDVDHKRLFKTGKPAADEAGKSLYVTVYKGHVAVQDQKGLVVDIGAGEAVAVESGGRILRLPELPVFQVEDFVPSPRNFDVVQQEVKEVLLKGPIEEAGESLECVVQ